MLRLGMILGSFGVRYSFVSILKLFSVPSGTINSIRNSIESLIHSLPEKIPNNTV